MPWHTQGMEGCLYWYAAPHEWIASFKTRIEYAGMPMHMALAGDENWKASVNTAESRTSGWGGHLGKTGAGIAKVAMPLR